MPYPTKYDALAYSDIQEEIELVRKLVAGESSTVILHYETTGEARRTARRLHRWVYALQHFVEDAATSGYTLARLRVRVMDERKIEVRRLRGLLEAHFE